MLVQRYSIKGKRLHRILFISDGGGGGGDG
jgi:hypothetical protein